jgi:NAD-dependent dihydropyrimidine dehydrogenase PreA subunit
MVDQFVLEKKPPQREYLGLRRSDISWAPIVDTDKCDAISCGQYCIKYCPFGVYEVSSDGLKAVVKNPGNCNVGDEACKWRCPNDALSFPSREELRAQLTSLRQTQGKKGSDAGEAVGGEK